MFDTRPSEWLKGNTHVAETPMGRAYITVNFFKGEPAEIFINLGKSGSEERAAAEALGRLCSVALQHHVPLRALTRQLRGISSDVGFGFGANKTLSMPDAVGKVLENYIQEKEKEIAP